MPPLIWFDALHEAGVRVDFHNPVRTLHGLVILLFMVNNKNINDPSVTFPKLYGLAVSVHIRVCRVSGSPNA
jgi:hypothetical protein